MKKVLFFAVTAIAVLGFSSCKEKVCYCVEEVSGYEQEYDLTGNTMYHSCDEVEDLLHDVADDLDASWQDWNCR